jgi:hypothetical protein
MTEQQHMKTQNMGGRTIVCVNELAVAVTYSKPDTFSDTFYNLTIWQGETMQGM